MFALCAAVVVVAFVIVEIAMFRRHRLLALWGVLSFGLFSFLWGWVFWRSLLKLPVMLAWTAGLAGCFLTQPALVPEVAFLACLTWIGWQRASVR